MRHPEGAGAYTLAVEDALCPWNTGAWQVRYEDGAARAEVAGVGARADLIVDVPTLTQLLVGTIDLATAAYREGTAVNGNRQSLERVFRRRSSFAG